MVVRTVWGLFARKDASRQRGVRTDVTDVKTGEKDANDAKDAKTGEKKGASCWRSGVTDVLVSN